MRELTASMRPCKASIRSLIRASMASGRFSIRWNNQINVPNKTPPVAMMVLMILRVSLFMKLIQHRPNMVFFFGDRSRKSRLAHRQRGFAPEREMVL